MKVRLFVEAPLATVAPDIVVGSERAHYLMDVMRLRAEDEIRVFNGRDGEWTARLIGSDRRRCSLRLGRQIAPQTAEAGPWLAFALIKRSRLDLLVEKATELGVQRLRPVTTQRTVTGVPNPARMRAITIEAAEQCGRMSLPQVDPPEALAQMLRGWPPARPLLAMSPGPDGRSIADACRALPRDVAPGVLIGPEGGLTASELDELLSLPFVVPVSLGRLVLRAETAAMAALACVQALGAWAQAVDEGV